MLLTMFCYSLRASSPSWRASRVQARLPSLAQIGELARRLVLLEKTWGLYQIHRLHGRHFENFSRHALLHCLSLSWQAITSTKRICPALSTRDQVRVPLCLCVSVSGIYSIYYSSSKSGKRSCRYLIRCGEFLKNLFPLHVIEKTVNH